MRVLIAEDETIIRLDLRQMLERHGMTVCAEARDGLEAVDLARELEPDVAVLDLRMPKLDGIGAARRMYAERPLPIVMLTAFADRANVEDAIDAGVFTYLVVTEDSLGVAKDEMAAKPLVLYESDNLVALASEEVAIRALIPHEIDTYDPYERQVLVWTR